MRSDKDKHHLRLKPFVSKELDTEFGNICKRAECIKKVHKLMNVIKANGMYSEREMNLDIENYQLMNVPKYERNVLLMAWNFRTTQTKQLCIELDNFMKRCLEADKK